MPAEQQATEDGFSAANNSPHKPTLRFTNGGDSRPDDTAAASDPEEKEEEEDEDEPRLKYKKLTGSLKTIYRNGDATSAVLVAGDKMVIGTHNGNIHALNVLSLAPIRFYHAHSATITCLSISPLPPTPYNRPSQDLTAPTTPSKSPSRASSTAPANDSPKPSRSQQAPVPKTPSNQVYIASASLDGHVCVASLVDATDVTLRNFARPVQAVALSPDYKTDRTYLSAGLAGQLVLTVGGKTGVSAEANTNSAVATASGWLGSIGLGTNTGKDTVLHSGEGSISAIKFSRTAKYVAWVNEQGIKILRSHLKLGTLDPDSAWKRFAHVDRPTRAKWDEMSSVWKAHLDWIKDSELEADQDSTRPDSSSGINPTSNRPEKLLVGWGDTVWILHVHSGVSDAQKLGRERSLGKADLVHKLTFDDCILSGLSLYTPSLLLVLAYRIRDDNDNPIPTTPAAAGSRRQKHNGLQPELRIVKVFDGDETDADTLPVDRFASLSAPDYHLSTLYIPPPVRSTERPQQKGTFESLGAGLRDVSTNATRLFHSNASISSATNNAEPAMSSMLSPAASVTNFKTRSWQAETIGPAVTPGLKIYLHSPYDLVLAMKRDLGDHFHWLLDHQKYDAAWELLDEHPSIVGPASDAQSDRSILSTPSKVQGSLAEFFGDRIGSRSATSGDDAQKIAVYKEKARIGELWLEQLTKAEQWTAAGQVAGKVLTSLFRWEHWVLLFARVEHLPDIAAHIPGTDVHPHLPSLVYEVVLSYYVTHDRPRFYELLGRWDLDMFDTTSVATTIQDQLDAQQVSEDSVEDGVAGRDWQILLNGLAKLKLAAGLPQEALLCHIRLKNSAEAMDLIRDHRLVNAVADDVAGLLMLSITDEQLKTGDMAVLQNGSADIVQLLVEEARDRTVPAEVVVAQLESKGKPFDRFLFLYFQALWTGPVIDPDSVLSRTDRTKREVERTEGRALVDSFADKVLDLFATYGRELLVDFLRQSTSYSLDRATEICEGKHYISELVYLFSKTGQTRRALFLIIKELGDVSQAIAFAKEHSDLWDDLLDYSMGKPAFILALLSEVGTSIDPVQLIRRIPEGMQIEGLKDGIQKMVREYDIQHSISLGAVRVFHGEVASSMDVLRAGQRRGVKFEVSRSGSVAAASASASTDVEVKVNPVASRLSDETMLKAGMSGSHIQSGKGSDQDAKPGHCVGCYDVFGTQEDDFLIGFACGHVFHLQCLLDRLKVSDTERTMVKSLTARDDGDDDDDGGAARSGDGLSSGALIRSVNAKISEAQIIRRAIKGGCPVCVST